MKQQSFIEKKRIRYSFGVIGDAIIVPNLIQIQKDSYAKFLQRFKFPKDRKDIGLEAVFRSVFPITDFAETARLEYIAYKFEAPKFDVEECGQRGITYAMPLRVTLRLIVYDVDEDTGARTVKDIKEQDVYMGEMPLMTDNGTFVINGTERVIVSQMHRSPGVFFDHDKGKTHSSGKILYSARIIPYRGSWLDFEFDPKDILHVRIDRKRKLPVTTLLYSFGWSSQKILEEFYDILKHKKISSGWTMPFNASLFKGVKLEKDLVNSENAKVVAKKGDKLTARKLKDLLEGGLKDLLITQEDLHGRFFACDIVNMENGAIYVEAGDEVTPDNLDSLLQAGIESFQTLNIDLINKGAYIRNTVAVDNNYNRDMALIDIYRIIRPGEPPTKQMAEDLYYSLFFDPDRYDLSDVGRVKMNLRLGFEGVSDEIRTLREEDIVEVIRAMVNLRDTNGEVDDIDNLGNRRVRSVGELIENQYRVGLLRMERAIKERVSTVDIATVMPHDLVNAKPAASAVREFFGSSQLSQFMDQTNPLSEITHKRRISALGPGGLTRERAGFEVRDVHPTHYGRICPIETPEGPNIGLINSLATHAKINKYGFIESPYCKVVNKVVTDEVVYLSAMEEQKYPIAQANAEIDKDKKLVNEFVNCRYHGDATLVPVEEVAYIDVSPKQIVSVAAALIPFLENDDANRALMGSNMQRQAVPLVKSEAPLVGTGMEKIVARDSGALLLARRAGIVEQVDAQRIVIRAFDADDLTKPGVDIYNLHKFKRSNQSTCINQHPLVKENDEVLEGDVIADGPSTDLGELALGRNVLVAFMPWSGYNYEDSILISERIVKEDVFTSIHIEEYEIMARDTKLGAEEITRDIPNVSDENLRHLDEAGIVAIGSELSAGDILVGKVTPKGESPMTPEEKLLRAIFGEKAAEVRDTSLKLPPGARGTVVDVRVLNRHGIEKDDRTIAIERKEIEALAKDRDAEFEILERNIFDRLRNYLTGKTAISGPVKAGVITKESLQNLSLGLCWQIALESEEVMSEVEALKKVYEDGKKALDDRFDDKVDKLQRGDELLPGVLKMVKVYVAIKRKLQPGDKMAGRHGNKGVISKIAQLEDMPFLADGTAVDIVLNPLGVPSRMNVGQILETHLGWACSGLGKQIGEALKTYKHTQQTDEIRELIADLTQNKVPLPKTDQEVIELAKNMQGGVPIATPVFDGAKEADIVRLLEKAGLDASGQVTLYDGKTGDKLTRKVTIGYKYLLKLHHLVDDKLHARSIGPYSLVTQQPLGGKAQFGGQRFGEMEVWALEAYGAAYTLQEMLTVKSDDVAGRTKVYESIVRGEDGFESGIPESFNVLIKEMCALGLNVELRSR